MMNIDISHPEIPALNGGEKHQPDDFDCEDLQIPPFEMRCAPAVDLTSLSGSIGVLSRLISFRLDGI